MAGLQVNRGLLDMKASEAVLAVREAIKKVQTIAAYLATVPVGADGVDPLTAAPVDGQTGQVSSAPAFGYTAAEAQNIRFVFNTLASMNIQPVLDAGRKLTGLE